jgi:tetratricopeptide (TPR) repeat protein
LDLRDRRINPAKLESWCKRYSSEARDLEQQPSSISSCGISRQHTPAAEEDTLDAEESSLGRVADAPPYSQPLSLLLEALEAALSSSSPLFIETFPSREAQTISLEDLRELSCQNNRFLAYVLDEQPISTQQEIVHTYKEDYETAQLPWRDVNSIFFGWNESPLNEIYVFPKTSASGPRTSPLTSKTVCDSLKDQEIELINKISILKRSLAPDHPAIIATTEALALVNYDQGNHKQAETLLRRVEELRADTLGQTNLKLLWTSSLIATVLERQGKYDQAWEIIKRIEPAILRLVNPEHDLAVEVMETKSLLLDSMDDLESAEEMYRQVFQIRLRTIGPRDPETRGAINNLGNLLVRKEEFHGAEKLLRAVLQIYSESADPHNWRFYSSMANLGWALRRQKSYDESFSIIYDAVLRSKVSLGPEHPETLWIQTDLAWILCEQGRFEESEDMFRATLSLQCKMLGDSAFDTLLTIEGLGRLLVKIGRFEEAISWYEKLLRISLDVYGPANIMALNACDNLGKCYEEEERYLDALELYQQIVEKLRSCRDVDQAAVARYESYIEDINEMMFEDGDQE